MDQETYDKARRYQLDKTNFGLIRGVVNEFESAVGSVLSVSLCKIVIGCIMA